MSAPEFVIAIDGLAASGKSTIAEALSRYFSLERVDSGSFYRFVAYYFLTNRVDWKNEVAVKESLETMEFDYQAPDHYLKETKVTNLLRSPEVEKVVSEVARILAVRDKVNQFLWKYCASKRLVVEGRDIGTVVFPGAQVKLFVTAKEVVRSKRRAAQSEKIGYRRTHKEARENLRFRDTVDSTRDLAPAIPAEDAIQLDTSSMSLKETIKLAISLVKERTASNAPQGADPRKT